MKTNFFFLIFFLIIITLSSCKVLKKNDCDCPNFGMKENASVKTNS